MERSFVKTLLITLVTFVCAAASFLAIPVAIFGLMGLSGRVADASAEFNFIVGLQTLGLAVTVWTVSFLWLAWCEGRLQRWRFSVRSLLVTITAAAMLMGAIASWIAHLRSPN